MNKKKTLFLAGALLMGVIMVTGCLNDFEGPYPEGIEEMNEESREDVMQALAYAAEQEVCTAQYMELVSPYEDVVYQATDGCQISYLLGRGWAEKETEEDDEEVIDTEEEQIQQAIAYAEEQEVCTEEYKELISPSGEHEYNATDGCQISYLEEKGWTEKETEEDDEETVATTGDEEITQAVAYAEEQEMCTTEQKELQSPDGRYTFTATDGCQISYLEEKGWTERRIEEDPETQITLLGEEDAHCSWVSVNCCPPQSGANWMCINEEESTIKCPEEVICPMVYVGEPEGLCVSLDGVCTVVDE